VSVTVEQELVRSLKRAHGLETQAMSLLDKGSGIAGDDQVGAICRAHLMQTKEHERYVAERLEAHGERPSKARHAAMHAGAPPPRVPAVDSKRRTVPGQPGRAARSRRALW
jgi:ferritin-like metal-binding protein YciE